MTADPSPGGGPCRRAAALRPPLRAFVLPALAVLLAGCVAETVRKNPPRKGPVQTVGYIDLGGGEVRYSTDGWSWFVAGRRHAAVHLMHRVCGRFRPVVTKEFTKEGFSHITGVIRQRFKCTDLHKSAREAFKVGRFLQRSVKSG